MLKSYAQFEENKNEGARAFASKTSENNSRRINVDFSFFFTFSRDIISSIHCLGLNCIIFVKTTRASLLFFTALQSNFKLLCSISRNGGASRFFALLRSWVRFFFA